MSTPDTPKDPDESVEELLLRDPSEPLTVPEALQLATALHRAGDMEPAEIIYRRVLEAAPDHPDATHFLGMLCHDRNRTEEALTLISRSVELVPGHAPFRSNLGNVLLDSERFEEAEREYGEALALDPDRPDTLNNYGVLCKALGRYEEAERHLLRAIALAEDFADARNNLALLYARQGRLDEALAQSAEALIRRPLDARSREMQGYAYCRLGRFDEAARIYREWLAEEPDNPKALHHLAACTGEGIPPRASDAYIQLVFDVFSRSFDAKLARLEYRAPALVTEAVSALIGDPSGDLDVLDAGCGTGLCAQSLRPFARCLDGVDLSEGMLAKAQGRNLYDSLHQAELTAFMQGRPGTYDLVVSADTLVYFGELSAALKAAACTLRPGGHLSFTLEALGDDEPGDFLLRHHGRYAHSRSYVEDTLVGAGLMPVSIRADWLRTEYGERVAGWLTVARRP